MLCWTARMLTLSKMTKKKNKVKSKTKDLGLILLSAQSELQNTKKVFDQKMCCASFI